MEPLEIIGVVTEEVGTPRSDGTAGSGLYAVPIRLSREADSDEARLLTQNWERPPQWTSMHRPGIARVSGDRFILDGTTVDEVQQYHARTVALVVAETNKQAAEIRKRRAAEAERATEQAALHRAHVENMAGKIKFDT